MKRNILVIGATGLLGKPVANRLKDDGFKVRIMARNPEKAVEQLGYGFEIVQGDIQDKKSIAQSLDGCFGVHINLSGKLEQTGVEIVSSVAAKLKLQRIAYISGTSVAEENIWVPVIKRFDLITMIFCDYCALSPAQRKTLLAKFYSFLKPGGSVLLDVHSINIFNGRDEVALYELKQLDGFWSPAKYYGFLNTFKYVEEKVTLDKYTIIEKNRTRIVYNWLQYFTQDSLPEEFEENGFEIEEFYSDVAGSTFSIESPDIAIVAGKAENTV